MAYRRKGHNDTCTLKMAISPVQTYRVSSMLPEKKLVQATMGI